MDNGGIHRDVLAEKESEYLECVHQIQCNCVDRDRKHSLFGDLMQQFSDFRCRPFYFLSTDTLSLIFSSLDVSSPQGLHASNKKELSKAEKDYTASDRCNDVGGSRRTRFAAETDKSQKPFRDEDIDIHTPIQDEQEIVSARWRRNRRAARGRNKDKYNAYIAMIKSHFADIDAVELAVETPTPPGKHAHCYPPPPMSFGLSSRTPSVCRTSILLSRSIQSAGGHTPMNAMSRRSTLLESSMQWTPVISHDAIPNPTHGEQDDLQLPGEGNIALLKKERKSTSMSNENTRRSSSFGIFEHRQMPLDNTLEWLARRGSFSETARSTKVRNRYSDRRDSSSHPSKFSDVSKLEKTVGKGNETNSIFTIAEEQDDGVEDLGRREVGETIAPSREEQDAKSPVIGDILAEIQREFGRKLQLAPGDDENVEDHESQILSDLLESPKSAHRDPREEDDDASVLDEQTPKPSKRHGDVSSIEGPKTPTQETPLQRLLRFCGHDEDSGEGNLPSMDELLGRHVDLTKVSKIGEGTFGEAFKAGSTVLKIVPMESDTLVNGEPQKRADEILAEVVVTLTLSELRERSNPPETDRQPLAETSSNTLKSMDSRDQKYSKESRNITAGFVQTYGVGVCQGRYAPALLREWHRWDEEHESENDPVDIFQEDQLYVVFVVADGGIDLEHYEPQNFAELQSVLLQAALTLAVAEEACCFEHRDLHWGNILIRRDGTETVKYRLRGVDITVQAAGVRVTLIDFTLSRLSGSDGRVAYCDLSADPEIFNGPRGDPQAETYRRMMKATRGDWKKYCPLTNALWIRYLVETILIHKLPSACGGEEKLALRNFKKEATLAESATDLVWAELFKGMWSSDGSI